MSRKEGRKRSRGKTRSEIVYEYLVAKGKEFSKNLSNNPTKWELMLKKHLQDLHYRFQFQFPIICNRKHLYIVDFLLTDYNIIIEVDGYSSHAPKECIRKDRRRDKHLRKEGYEILRLWNRQVSSLHKEEIDEIIKQKIITVMSDKPASKQISSE